MKKLYTYYQNGSGARCIYVCVVLYNLTWKVSLISYTSPAQVLASINTW